MLYCACHNGLRQRISKPGGHGSPPSGSTAFSPRRRRIFYCEGGYSPPSKNVSGSSRPLRGEGNVHGGSSLIPSLEIVSSACTCHHQKISNARDSWLDMSVLNGQYTSVRPSIKLPSALSSISMVWSSPAPRPDPRTQLSQMRHPVEAGP